MTTDPRGGEFAEAGFDLANLERALSERPLSRTADAPTPRAQPFGADLVHASLRGTFQAADIGLDPAGLVEVLERCEVVLSGRGQAWQVKPEVRRRAIAEARSSGRLEQMLGESTTRSAGGEPSDPEGELLRSVLRGDAVDPETIPADDLERLIKVAGWLGEGEIESSLPSVAALRHVQQRRSILDPFRLLVGWSAGAEAGRFSDHVVGRDDEIERLRSHVGVLPPERMIDYASRAWTSLSSFFLSGRSDNQPLSVTGIGGVGKSTLIAKFIVDHALHPSLAIPFVYLDFDRAALAPRQPLQLLIEATLQLASQFPDSESEFRQLRRDLRQAIDKPRGGLESATQTRATASSTSEFCNRMKRLISSVKPPGLPVIFIFDTVELIQYDCDAASGVTGLIDALRQPAAEPWLELRVIVSGRTELPLETKVKPIKLGALPLSATRTLLARRSERLELELTSRQIAVLAPALKDSPLHVTLVTNWLKQARDAGSADIGRLVGDLSGDMTAGEPSGTLASVLALGILVNRMIGHIRDPEVRDLVMPGMVVRTVTSDLVRDVMAPAGRTLKRALPLDDGRANDLFRRLALESWLVERVGDGLRHRPEVRQAMLGHMRRSEPARFEEANKLAIAFFRRKATADMNARAELAYHLLMRLEPALHEADQLLDRPIARRLAGSVEDLSGPARDLLKAKLGRSVDIDRLEALPPSAIRSALRDGAQAKRYLAKPDAVLDVVRKAFSPNHGEDPGLAGVQAEAWHRSGRWSEGAEELRRGAFDTLLPRGWNELQSWPASRRRDFGWLVRWATRDNAFDEIFRRWVPWLDDSDIEPTVELGTSETERLPWDILVYVAAAQTRRKAKEQRSLPRRFASRWKGRVPSAAHASGALRILCMLEVPGEARLLGMFDWNGHFGTVAGADLALMRELVEQGASDRLDAAASGLRTMLTERATSLLDRLPRDEDHVYTDLETTREFASLMPFLATPEWPRGQAVAQEMLRRVHPDWIEPLGNCLTRAFDGAVPQKTGLFANANVSLGTTGRNRRRGATASDGITILSYANEARRLPEVVEQYRQFMKRDGNGSDFRLVADQFRVWRSSFASNGRPSL